LSVIIPERAGSFLELHNHILPRAVTEFSYRWSSAEKAFIFLSFSLNSNTAREEELQSIVAGINSTLAKHNPPGQKRPTFHALDISQNELAKSHARYLVGGRQSVPNERLFRFEFPERPGALKKFLEGLRSGWNISLFHYRFIGGDIGKILAGFQIPSEDSERFDVYLKELDYRYVEETDNVVVKSYLGGVDEQ
jgi:threonine dehydratase